MTKPRVIITRTQPGADRLATRLQAMGYETSCLPLLRAVPTQNPAPSVDADGLIVTSSHALRCCSLIPSDLPLYAVGDATASLARDMGWQTVITGQGDVQGLAKILPRDAVLLHLRAHDVSPLTDDALAPLNVTPWVVYETLPDTDIIATIPTILSGAGKTVVLIQSGRSAAILAPYVQAYETRMQAGEIIFLCLSAAVVEFLREICPDKSLYVAASPDEDALIEVLQTL